MLAAAHLKSVITALNGKPEIHLLGHSAGAIMQGYFLDALKTNGLTAETIHLWAPACTVELATATYGAAFANNVAKPRSTFVELLTDANEERYGCVPGGYSMSLLYLVSRALEPDHKTPILGMQKVWRKWRDDTAFNSDAAFKQDLDAWQQTSKSVALADPIATEKVPRLREKNKEDLIDADHGSFDNNLDVVNRAIAHILGREEPKVVVTDLRGF